MTLTARRGPWADVPDATRPKEDGLRAVARELAREVSDRLDGRIGQAAAANRPLDRAHQEAIFGEEVEEVLRRHAEARLGRNQPVLSDDEEYIVKESIHDLTFGLAGLQPLLDTPDVTEICVNRFDEVWLHYPDGTRVPAPPVAPDDDELRELIRRVGSRGGDLGNRPFDVSHPILDLMLPDGSRFNAVDHVTDGPTVTIRRHTLLDVRWAETVGLGMLTQPAFEFLGACLADRRQIMVGGPTGVGKTTLVRAMADAFGADERVITIESDRELRLPRDRHTNMVALQARQANIEGIGEVDLVALVRNALRMAPDRIIVGEVRGPETLAMLWAMNTGHKGSISTIHADSARGVFENISLHGMLSPERVPPASSLALAGQALDVVVFMSRDRHGRVGYVSSIHHVEGFDGTQVKTNELFAPGPDGRAVPHVGIPHDLRQSLEAVGYEPGSHQPRQGWIG